MKNKYNLVQLKYSQIPQLKEKILNKNNNICPITKIFLDSQDAVLDHKHKDTKKSIIGDKEQGLVRDVIHTFANTFEGKVISAYYRTGLGWLEEQHPDLNIYSVLRNLADYLEKNDKCAYTSGNNKYIHPSEAPKTPVIQKDNFNKLIKLLKESGYKNKLPVYKNKQSLTKELKKLYSMVDLPPKFYKT